MSVPGIIILVFVVVFIFIFNSLIMKRNMVDNAMALIDAYLKKRCDLIPNLVAAASQYMQHESETLTRIADMRTQAKSVAEKSDLDRQLTGSLRNFMVQLEAYPDLKASESIMLNSAKLIGGDLDIDAVNAVQPLGHSLCEIDGPVLPAGASEGNLEMAAAIALVFRD